jgi:hypothetical protein
MTRLTQKHDPDSVIRGRVTKVNEDHVVAHALADVGDITTKDSITFSLDSWNCDNEPQPGQTILLINPMLYMRGWRAREAYPV